MYKLSLVNALVTIIFLDRATRHVFHEEGVDQTYKSGKTTAIGGYRTRKMENSIRRNADTGARTHGPN
jgi:hypothetical protein